MRVVWAQAVAVAAGLGGSGGCVFLGADDDPIDGTDTTDAADTTDDDAGDGSGSGDALDESDDGSSDTGDPICAPQPSLSCADAGAPTVRGLENDEWLGISTDTISDLVFGTTTVTRSAPRPEHPAYVTVFLTDTTGTISAGLSEATLAALTKLAEPLDSAIGVYGSGRDATIRLGDGQSCAERAADCEDQDALLDAVEAIDAALLEAWWAQDEGVLYPLAEVAIQPWPLSLSWGEGGEHEVTQAQWESLTDSWYVDAGETAHVGRSCYGGGDGCTTWLLDVSIVERVDSPLSDAQHAELLAMMPWAFVGFGLPLAGDDFEGVREAQLLDFADPDDPTYHHTLTVVSRPWLVVDATF